MASEPRRSFLGKVGSLFAPRTPRGKVRRATFLVLVLLVLAGSMSDARAWNRAADAVNGLIHRIPKADKVGLPHFPENPFHLGLDLQGGTHLVYTADMAKVPESDRDQALSGVRDVIERRV